MHDHSAQAVDVVAKIMRSSANGQLHSGDSIAVWTFNSDVYTGNLPLQTWTVEDRDEITLRLMEFLRRQHYEKEGSLALLMSAVNRIVKVSDILTIILISDGHQPMQGTPFDREINLAYLQSVQDMKKNPMPVVTVLQSKHGKLFRYTVNALPWPVVIPEVPIPIKMSDDTTAPVAPPAPTAKTVATPIAPIAPKPTVTPAPVPPPTVMSASQPPVAPQTAAPPAPVAPPVVAPPQAPQPIVMIPTPAPPPSVAQASSIPPEAANPPAQTAGVFPTPTLPPVSPRIAPPSPPPAAPPVEPLPASVQAAPVVQPVVKQSAQPAAAAIDEVKNKPPAAAAPAGKSLLAQAGALIKSFSGNHSTLLLAGGAAVLVIVLGLVFLMTRRSRGPARISLITQTMGQRHK